MAKSICSYTHQINKLKELLTEKQAEHIPNIIALMKSEYGYNEKDIMNMLYMMYNVISAHPKHADDLFDLLKILNVAREIRILG